MEEGCAFQRRCRVCQIKLAGSKRRIQNEFLSFSREVARAALNRRAIRHRDAGLVGAKNLMDRDKTLSALAEDEFFRTLTFAPLGSIMQQTRRDVP
ncbi:hypothetical protein DC522_19860 [Microvirga sp. KLBC 81]|nr:hypothetical protein DC522_19860 [Microvirga sp. KLBC 81]